MPSEARISLVTGAARGIGAAIARRMAAAGSDVVLVDLLGDEVAEVAKSIEATGRRALVVRADVSRSDDVHRMVAESLDALGRIDCLFNNAGIISVQPFMEVTADEWDRIMAVNARGAFLVGQAVARQMIEQGGGRIVNTASVASHIGIPDMVAYAASKAAVLSLTRSMSIELAPHGITVNALAPGIVDTDMWTLIDRARGEIRGKPEGASFEERVKAIPLGRAASAEDIAATAEYLVSDASSYITGQTIGIDGGTFPR